MTIQYSNEELFSIMRAQMEAAGQTIDENSLAIARRINEALTGPDSAVLPSREPRLERSDAVAEPLVHSQPQPIPRPRRRRSVQVQVQIVLSPPPLRRQ